MACSGLAACAGTLFQQAQQQAQLPGAAPVGPAVAAAPVTATEVPTSVAANADTSTMPAAASTEVAFAQPEARAGARAQLGRPYEIAGNWYTPQHDPDYDETGLASWYGESFRGQLTANGELFDDSALTAAHPTLPLPSYARVTNTTNNRSVMVRINDRGPFSSNRMIDVSARTAELLDFKRTGVANVRVEYVSPARLDGDDAAFLLASYHGPDAAPAATMLASAAPAPQAVPRPAPAAPVILASLRLPPVSSIPSVAAPTRGASRPAAVASGAPFDPFQTLSDTRTLWSPVAFTPADGFTPKAQPTTGTLSLRSSFAPDQRVTAAFEAIALLAKP